MNFLNNIINSMIYEKKMVNKETQTDESFLTDFFKELGDFYTSKNELINDINEFKNFIFN